MATVVIVKASGGIYDINLSRVPIGGAVRLEGLSPEEETRVAKLSGLVKRGGVWKKALAYDRVSIPVK